MTGWDAYDWQWIRPQVLWLLLAALPILAALHVHSLSDFPRWQRRLSLLIRSLIVVCLVLALAGVVVLSRTARQMIVFAVDQSESIDAASRQVAERFLEQATEQAAARPDIQLRFVGFDSQPAAAVTQWPPAAQASERAAEQVDAEQVDAEQVDAEQAASERAAPARGTDLAAAIRSSVAAIPPSYVPRLVLLSDGNPTTGDALAAAASSPVPIDTVPLPVRAAPDIQLAAVDAPAQVRQGEPFFVEVLVNANVAARGFIDLYRGDLRVDDHPAEAVNIRQGENRFRFRQSISDERQVIFTARLRGFADSDRQLDNNQAAALVFARGRPRVLLIDSDVEQVDALRWALDEQEIDVEVRSPEGLPSELLELQRFECLVLSNVPATAMSIRQMELIRTYVQDLGGGLIMLGGDQSFGLGGYYKSQLEEILPVRSNFEKEREKPGFAMVLVIDRSGSMGGEKIELAKDAALAAVELMGPRDAIGVIAFDNEAYWVSELRSGADAGYLIDQMATIDSGGGTNMYPAMEQAFEALADAEAKLKHCILLTDGISEPGDFTALAAQMSAQQITVSTVAMGDGADEKLLQDIARIGGGRHYVCADPQSVPQVFAKETVEASKSALNELPFLPQVVRPTSVLAGIDLEFSPLLLGYVATRAKPTSELILATESGDPLLAWWRYGLGMCVAFTSDAKSRWAAEWLVWPEFGTFWAQVIRHAMRKNDQRDVFVQLQPRGERTQVIVDAVGSSGRFVDQADAQLTVIDPRLQTAKLPLQETAPGRYEASIASDQQGAYQLNLSMQRPGSDPVQQSRGFVVSYSDELRLQPIGSERLQRIAHSSGGIFDPSPEDCLRNDGRTAARPIALWPLLLMLGIVFFVADVALRRVVLSGVTRVA